MTSNFKIIVRDKPDFFKALRLLMTAVRGRQDKNTKAPDVKSEAFGIIK